MVTYRMASESDMNQGLTDVFGWHMMEEQTSEELFEDCREAAFTLFVEAGLTLDDKDDFGHTVDEELQSLLMIVMRRFPQLRDKLCGKVIVDDTPQPVEPVMLGPGEVWTECGLCGEQVTENSLDVIENHACCGCGWRDATQDKPDWVCPNCRADRVIVAEAQIRKVTSAAGQAILSGGNYPYRADEPHRG